MPKTIVVGDSVALGIGQAIKGAQIIAEESRTVATMQPMFNSALATAEKGDTVIIAAGYNSTGANGLSADDVKLLQTGITALNEKGAKVVVVPLRESGMTGGYAALNGATAKTNAQLAKLTGATYAADALAIANNIQGGDIHGSYQELAAAAQGVAAKATGGVSAVDREVAAADEKKEQGWGEWIMDILYSIPLIGPWLKKMFGGDDNEQAAANDNVAGAPAKAKDEGKAAPDANVKAQAQAAAKGNAASGTGKDVADNDTPSLPDAKGPRVKAVG